MTGTLLDLDNLFARELAELAEQWHATPVPRAELLIFNDALASELGLDSEALRSSAGVAVLAGNEPAPGPAPVAMAYAGHQFGGFSPQLGDGRALLLGEVVGPDGIRRDVHLKGSGRTPFARGGDGKAAIGPMLREYVIGEAMHALDIPTTRSLAVVSTGESVLRQDGALPGAVLTRVARSHLRVGTFEYAARLGGPELVRRLADHAIERHEHPVTDDDRRYLAFFESVVELQARLVAQWMLVGFIHGVMNTDNTTISGETIDYGPCAFMDAHDPATVFSSVDPGGRYAFGNQPSIAQWNLARLAETLLALIDDDEETATKLAVGALDSFAEHYRDELGRGLAAKLGLPAVVADLVNGFLGLLGDQAIDHTCSFRALAKHLRGSRAEWLGLAEPGSLDEWTARWRTAVEAAGRPLDAVADAMDAVNPVYIARNHLVEEALDAATAGDLGPFEQLVEVVASPFDERPGLERYALPAPTEFNAGYQTFCGT